MGQLPPAEIRAILAQLDPETAEALLSDWELWARPEQLPPESAWFCWLILAGRGWGKTRTGAEYIRRRAESGRYRRFALIGQDAADVRDVMVEGESGLLAIAHPRFRPKYEPSKRRVTWPNGAIATCYSGDDPEQLRGPQHDTAWCLIGETPVVMGDGTRKPIAAIRPGEYVQTRNGPKRVTMQALTKHSSEVYLLHVMGGRCIIGTGNHLIWVVGKGFTPLSTIYKGESVCVTRALNGMGGSGIGGAMITIARFFGCIVRFGSKHTAQSPRGAISTTKTGTSPTIDSKTLNCLPMERTAPSIIVRSWHRIKSALPVIRSSHGSATGKIGSSDPLCASFVTMSTTVVQSIQVATVHHSVLRLRDRARSKVSSGGVSIAGLRTMPPNERSSSAPGNVRRGLARIARRCWRFVTSIARSVAECFNRSAQMRGFAPGRVPLLSTATIVSVQKLKTRHDVYDIAVDGAREFFADGILVHNCDELAKWRYAAEAWSNMEFGLRLGDDPRVVVTTTPRPIPIILELQKDPQTVRPLYNLSTKVNLPNVSTRFVERVVRKYEGTRLGRQELEAEILTDTPGALWSLATLDACRVDADAVPALTRIVVAIDPSVGDGESDDQDEAGIVAAGLGVNGHGYVLADASLTGAPVEWAEAAIALYHRLSADRIVAERNNGGAMVEHTIRTAGGGRIRVVTVWASRGKYTRAEPISLLYTRQGGPIVHHVGAFAPLEDEMRTYVPGQRKSPNRLDALVWALTELFPNEAQAEDAPPAVGGQRRRMHEEYRP